MAVANATVPMAKTPNGLWTFTKNMQMSAARDQMAFGVENQSHDWEIGNNKMLDLCLPQQKHDFVNYLDKSRLFFFF